MRQNVILAVLKITGLMVFLIQVREGTTTVKNTEKLQYKPSLKVPFYNYTNDMASQVGRATHMKDNIQFKCEMRFVEFLFGRSSKKALIECTYTGMKYEMFMSDFESLLQNGSIDKGVFTDTFFFRNQSGYFGLVPILGRELEVV